MPKELVQIKIPVFLPDNNRGWDQVDGIAQISDEGEIRIKLSSAEKAQWLIALAKDGCLFACSFDYRITEE